MNKTETSFTANADKDFGDCYFDISENSKRLVRATLKTYDQTGAYVFLKVFKKATEGAEFECVQRRSLSSEEFIKKILKSGTSIRAQTSENSGTIENKDKPQSNCKRARKSQFSSNTNDCKHDSNYFPLQNGRSYVRSCVT